MHTVRMQLLGAATTIFFSLAGLLGGAGSAGASVVQYDLTMDTCSGGCGLSNYGKVIVSDLPGGGVHVTASLEPNVNFIKSGALSNYALVFSLTGGSNITISIPGPSDFSVGDSTGGAPNISAGGTFGAFEYGIVCSACGAGGSSPKHGPIAFDITDTLITTSLFTDGLKTAGPNTIHTGAYFVVDVMGPNGNTGRVGAGLDVPNSNPDVPEPATLTLLGAALAGFGAMRRRRKQQ